MKCSACDGTGKRTNPEWLNDVDRMMDGGNYPDFYSASKQASRWNDRYVTCLKCNGTGQVPDNYVKK